MTGHPLPSDESLNSPHLAVSSPWTWMGGLNEQTWKIICRWMLVLLKVYYIVILLRHVQDLLTSILKTIIIYAIQGKVSGSYLACGHTR